MKANLLIELLTEELPPKALKKLSETFARGVQQQLGTLSLLDNAAVRPVVFATPRRLGMWIADVRSSAPSRTVSEKIMPVSVALTDGGEPTPALLKKLAARQIAPEAVAGFERKMDGKAECLFYVRDEAGAVLSEVLADVVALVLKALPVPKLMRWGDSEVQFVRPVHRLVMLYGTQVIPGEVLGLVSGRQTEGHRFMCDAPVDIADADSYLRQMTEVGRIVPVFEERRAQIEMQLQEASAAEQGGLGEYQDLLDEVTALVEHPTVYAGEFEKKYLSVPQECLILTMRANQKYFPLFDAAGKLLNRFLIVSNMRLANPVNVITGNERVVRPRLSDARFFYEQDRKTRLADRVPALEKVVYHNRLGSQFERVKRLQRMAGLIAGLCGADADAAARAAWLAKADLVTEMVGEFPELQGVMGRYYALDDGENEAVAEAIERHYYPRYAGDSLPQGSMACAVALADRLDALVAFFGIGQTPTGDKDPYGLRRAALGVLRILMETPLALDLGVLIDETVRGFSANILVEEGYVARLHDFMFERLRSLLRDAGHDADVIDAVLALKPMRIDLVLPKLGAVAAFKQMPEAEALVAANKRIINLLKKAGITQGTPDLKLLHETAEKDLCHQIIDIAPRFYAHLDQQQYTQALQALAGMRSSVDAFFDHVMVMAEDAAIRNNRLALLKDLALLMNQIADISRLGSVTEA